jgi:hypothetical protein
MRQPGLAFLLLLAACGGGSAKKSATPQPLATNSGALAVVAVGEELKAYVPGGLGTDGHYQLWVVNAALTRNGASANIGRVDLGIADGDAESVAAAPGIVVAVSFGTPNLWLIDPATDRVTKHLKLPDGYGSWDVSNRNAFMSGVAIDPVRRRAYVSVWSGFTIIDLDAGAFVGDILLAPTENFAFDAQRDLLVAPFYLCPDPSAGTTTPPPCDAYHSPDGTLITQGINVVDLQTSKVFTYVDAAAPDQSMPAGTAPDAAALDPAHGLALVPIEDPAQVLLLDLGGATFDAASGTFTASKIVLTTPPLMTGVAIEPNSRLGVGTQEADSGVGFYDLAATTGDGPITSGTMPDLPWGAGQWLGHSDPHNVLAGLDDGKPVAWLLSRSHAWLARIDLEKLKQLALASPDGIESASMAEAVTYVYVAPAP